MGLPIEVQVVLEDLSHHAMRVRKKIELHVHNAQQKQTPTPPLEKGLKILIEFREVLKGLGLETEESFSKNDAVLLNKIETSVLRAMRHINPKFEIRCAERFHIYTMLRFALRNLSFQISNPRSAPADSLRRLYAITLAFSIIDRKAKQQLLTYQAKNVDGGRI